MATAGGNPSHLSLPPLKTDQRSEVTDSIYKSERPSSIPLPIPGARPGSAPIFTKSVQPTPVPGPGPRAKSVSASPLQHRFLSPAEWARIAHGLGAIRDGETHTVIHPTCWYWPPKGLPDGLYKDVVAQRSKYFILYHLISTFRWFLLIMQIVLGAILTALGSVQQGLNTPITVLAALNTVAAGLLALMHNSGLPDRYRLDKVEFTKVEDTLKVCVVTGFWKLLLTYSCTGAP
ncbi:hypothetical protein OQA88_13100 [Cercophora sp. LCS_1]